tara:strand:+ start:4611 stop:5399 length:789 start_codon:yes stop_codon:yes gene_type:complete
MLRLLLLIILLFTPFKLIADTYPISLSVSQTTILANLIWKNEGAGKQQNLTVWNRNENFPSLGIGHFIWYPTKEKGPYIEQFPTLLAYIIKNEVQVPEWLLSAKTAPWANREIFYREFDEKKLTQLRKLMQDTVVIQAQFIIKRLEKGIPAILKASDQKQKLKINNSLSALIATPEGIFVLLDYINFKGEGVSDKEQYQGQGWGLKQVLLAMPEHTDNVLLSFALAADEMLTRRVKNAPRDELGWLKGWRVRVHNYPLLTIQ